MFAKYQVNKQHFSIQKSVGGNFTRNPRQRLRVQNTSVGIRSTAFTEPSDTVNYKLFFKLYFFQIFCTLFLLFIFVWTKSFVLKTELYFFYYLVFGVTILKVLCF